jgi:hypothetical protein
MGEKEDSKKSEVLLKDMDECIARAGKVLETSTIIRDRLVGYPPPAEGCGPKVEPADTEVFTGAAGNRLGILLSQLSSIADVLADVRLFI